MLISSSGVGLRGDVLRHDVSGVRHVLRARHLVGRSLGCDLRLAHGRASAEHAVLAWMDGRWMARDLASRHGTWVDGNKLAPGVWTPLRAGAVIRFGSERERWALASEDGPALFAEALGSGVVPVFGADDMLELPDPDRPELIVVRTDDGWTLEAGAETRMIEDREVVAIGGHAWRLALPHLPDPTAGSSIGPSDLWSVTLELRVSPDEEFVALRLLSEGGPRDLGARSHHGVLLQLARARLQDADAPEGSRGWVYVDELLRGLRLDDNTLNVQLHRARRQLADAGVERAAALVERRPSTRQIRLGTDNVRVVRG